MRDSAFLFLNGWELVAANLSSHSIEGIGVAAEGILCIVYGIELGGTRDSACLVLTGRKLVIANLFSHGDDTQPGNPNKTPKMSQFGIT
jgi:hypothetical protein